MLSGTMRENASGLLRLLEISDILSLATTVTKQLITVTNRQEAENAILDYSESALQLLKRKKVKRDALFLYLNRENIVVSASLEKIALVQQTLQHWGVGHVPAEDLMEVDDNLQQTVSESCSVPSSSSSSTSQASGSSSSSADFEPQRDNNANKEAEMREMAHVFARWFYQMLNANNPYSQENSLEPFGQHHFYSGCVLKVLAYSPEKSYDVYDGAEAVAKRLLEFVTESKLLFNPNLSDERLCAVPDRHGLRVINICGTVHTHDNIIGVFKQQFGMAQDPCMGNNWRIKYTKLLMTTEQTDSNQLLNEPFLAIES